MPLKLYSLPFVARYIVILLLLFVIGDSTTKTLHRIKIPSRSYMEGFVFRGCQLPPGFRFQPTDQEIIVYYLKKKMAATASAVTSIVADVDIYKFDPWELPDKAIFGEGEWFFFSPRDRKYPNGARPNRTAGSGYWKATGTDKPILAAGGSHCLGVKKALVFYQGRSPKSTKTEWVMHEYRLLDTDSSVSHKPNDSMRLDDWVLCRVRKKGVSFALEIDDKSEPSHVAVPAMSDYGAEKEDEAAPREVPDYTHGLDDWTEGQLFQFLMDSSQDMSAAAGGPAGHGMVPTGRGETSHALVSVLESIKRNLSFQAVDEMYLLQPSKRGNFLRGDIDEQLSPTSFLVSDVDEVF